MDAVNLFILAAKKGDLEESMGSGDILTVSSMPTNLKDFGLTSRTTARSTPIFPRRLLQLMP
jgi:hypothetical protein